MSLLPTILIVDENQQELERLADSLDGHFDVKTASNLTDAESMLEQYMVHAILCELQIQGASGIDFLTKVREVWPKVIRIIISKSNKFTDLLEGINEAHIHQYVQKPCLPEDLLSILNKAVRLFQLELENDALDLELKRTSSLLNEEVVKKRKSLQKRFQIKSGIICSPDSPMKEVCDLLAKIGGFDIPVLLIGESGTGKELCARALHYNGLRSGKSFIVENCAALPDELLESELFGHKKGAFTGATQDHIGLFEQADGGTIFLDEIGEVSPAFQVKLLRVLQENEIRPLGSAVKKKINVRVVSATNRDLEKDVLDGRFREDLYYRLAMMTITVPPLRERAQDIPLLAESILDSASKVLNKNTRGFTNEVIDFFKLYPWPGNIREMQNEIYHMLILAETDYIDSDLLSNRLLHPRLQTEDEYKNNYLNMEGTLKQKVESLETSVLCETLRYYHWNKGKVAEKLGLSRAGLNKKIDRYGIVKL